MNLKFVCFFLLLFLVLRAGLVKSVDGIESANIYVNNNVTKPEPPTSSKDKPIPIQSFPSNNILPDKCSESGVISDCTLEKPYCFVDGDNIFCGPVEESGWRISPLDGLVLNNGQVPNPNCELFNPPENPEIKGIIMNLLSYSEFGLGYKGRESAWFNIFEYLGNCPLKSQYCDKDSSTCENLFGVGVNCTSSNQCLSHYCEKYDQNAPDDTTERRCIEINDTKNSENSENSSKKKSNDNEVNNGFGSLLIIILLAIGSSTLILTLIIFLLKVQRRKNFLLNSSNKLITSNYSPNVPNDTTINQSRFVTKNFSLTSLRSSLFSRMSSNRSYSRIVKRDSSDQFSVLLPPPPTFDRDTFLYRNNDIDYNNHRASDTSVRESLDSFDIYSPKRIQEQYETSFI